MYGVVNGRHYFRRYFLIKKSTNRDDYQYVSNPFSAMSNEFSTGHIIAEHRHVRAQLVFAESGVMEIYADHKCWFIPPQRAFWLPSNVPHSMRAHGLVALRTFYVAPDMCRTDAPDHPLAVKVSPLLHELLVAAACIPVDYDLNGRDGLLMQLINEEINWADGELFNLAWPEDERIRHICEQLKDYPADSRSLKEWGELIGSSHRTLSRLFRKETGVTFMEWRQQARILYALPLLLSGVSVLETALAVGYETPSSFSALFRRLVGLSPREYLKK